MRCKKNSNNDLKCLDRIELPNHSGIPTMFPQEKYLGEMTHPIGVLVSETVVAVSASHGNSVESNQSQKKRVRFGGNVSSLLFL